MKIFPSKIQLDILKRHVGPFIFCFVTVMFLLLMQFLILYIGKLISKGLPALIILKLIVTNLAYMVVLAGPMAVLVASLMAFGKFTELNELTALRAAGVNPIHVINPVLIAGFLLSVFMFWFSNDVLPNANQRARSLFLDIRTKKPSFNLKANEFYNGINGYTFLVKRMPSDSDSLYDITLFQEPSAHRNEAVIKAKRGYLKSNNPETLTLYLYNGSIMRSFYRQEGDKITERSKFHRYRISFDISAMKFSQSKSNRDSRNDRTMNIQSMHAVVDSLQHQIKDETNNVSKKHTFITNNHGKKKKAHLFNQNTPSKRKTNHPYKSKYLLLQLAPTRSQQLELYQTAISGLRDYHSSYQNLKVNTDWRVNRIAQFWVEIYKKFSIPLACMIFVLIGAPIGMYTKNGNIGIAALIGTGFLTFYWLSLIQGEKLADRGVISPFTGMWLPDIILAVIGIIMTLQMCTPFRISKLWNNRDA
ncbi:MAG TPA: LptF/LptG family permease [Balneolaceae bacterium]|nr:LptF/LptG family permease [Balneolaceae bacterium]